MIEREQIIAPGRVVTLRDCYFRGSYRMLICCLRYEKAWKSEEKNGAKGRGENGMGAYAI